MRSNGHRATGSIVVFIVILLTSFHFNYAMADTDSSLKVLDIIFEPAKHGKNVVHVKVTNTSSQDQTLGVDIRAEALTKNWRRQFLDTIKGGETQLKSFDFEIFDPISDDISIRLRFYNPASADEFDINNWFEEKKYYGKSLDQHKIIREAALPVSKEQNKAIKKVFRKFQISLKKQRYEAVWGLVSENIRTGQFQDDLEKFKQVFSDDTLRITFLDLKPKSVSKRGDFLILSAKGGEGTWRFYFIEEDSQWKIYKGQEPDRGNWQERLLPTMQKRITKHFDIYYYKDSTAEKEIAQIVDEREKGFAEICKFLGKNNDARIRMIFFEDGKTKHWETGHQGAGWAFGNTIVEIYNENQKLDPYHETVHVLMGSYGNPPALFNEGFATYMSKRLGTHGLKSLGGGESSIYQRVRELKEKEQLWALEELIDFTEIGSMETRPPIAYPEAASFVKYLIDTYGEDKFLEAYKQLQNSDNKQVLEKNIEKLTNIYGKSFDELKKHWEKTFMARQI